MTSLQEQYKAMMAHNSPEKKKIQEVQREEADIQNLEQYLDDLYDENLDKKIISCRKLLLLTLNMANLDSLIYHDVFLGNISRTLLDDYKKSSELTIYLLCTFFIFSNYQQFHEILLQQKIGDTTMKIIQYQLERFEQRITDFRSREQKCIFKKKLQQLLQQNKITKEKREEFEIYLRRLNKMIAQQDKIFYIAFTILLNMAEDFSIEHKMKKRNIIQFLIKMLSRNDFNLMLIALLFLRKLSIVTENKSQMLQFHIIPNLTRFFTCNNNLLLQLALGLLKNLCFDENVRDAVEECGYLPKLIHLLKVADFRFMSIVILYLLTLNDRIRNSLAESNIINIVMNLIIHFPQKIVGIELSSLAINLSANKSNAAKITEGFFFFYGKFQYFYKKDEYRKIIDRAFKNEDAIIFKFIKNIAYYNKKIEIQTCLETYIQDFIKIAILKGKIEDIKVNNFPVEIIGILANLSIGDNWIKFDYANQAFMEFISQNITLEVTEDDIILETIVLISNIASTQKGVELLSKCKILKKIIVILIEKNEDEEFMLQCLYVIYQFLRFKIEIEQILDSEKIMEILIDNIQEPNQEVSYINDCILDILRVVYIFRI